MGCKIILLALCLIEVTLQIQCFTHHLRSDYQIDTRYLQLEVDGVEYNLTLKNRARQTIFESTPVWTLEKLNEGYSFSKVESETRRINGIYYQDDDYMASLLAYYNEDEKEIYYDGVIGKGSKISMIHAVPEKWWSRPTNTKNDEEESKSVEHDEEETQEALKLRSSSDGDKLDSPLSVLHPKLLVVVDYKLFELLGKNLDKTFKYVAAFWNAVDLRYSKLDSPKVGVLITGIVIASDASSNALEAVRESFSENFIKSTQYLNFDATFIMTASNEVASEDEMNLGVICNRQYSISAFQDKAGFEGLFTSIHQLGHLLSLPDDDAEICNANSRDTNTFMAKSITEANVLNWSQCSKDILQKFANLKAASCLADTYRYE